MSKGFRRFRVTRKVSESSIITSFYLSPIDGVPIWPAAPGQYLTLRIPATGENLLRTYSISTDSDNTTETRITVKREPSPPRLPEAAPGLGSNWLHDHAQVGCEIDIAAPRGTFVLNQDSERPVVLLSGGVGQTPLLCMLHALAKTGRRGLYLHACENGDVHAMQDEVSQLVSTTDGRIHQHVCYRAPSDSDRQQNSFHSEGFINASVLKPLLLLIDDYEWYLCGPTPFMVAMYLLLLELGVREERIAYEFFGKSKSLAVLATELKRKESQIESRLTSIQSTTKAGANAPASLANLEHLTNPDAKAAVEQPHASGVSGVSNQSDTKNSTDVVFAKSGVTRKWSESMGTLLELAEHAGLTPEFSCRSGICNTCICTITEGEVTYMEEPLETPESGNILICCSRPKGRVVLDL